MKPLHHALREARVRAGLSQTEAAELSGLARGTISDLERSGGKKPVVTGVTLKTLRTLADTYGFTVSELIGETEPPTRRMNVKERRIVDTVLEVLRAA